jgi:hypothetical protein
MTEVEEKKLTRLDKRLVANVNFDDPALQVLGFHTNMYYLLGHLGWVQFFQRSVDKHPQGIGPGNSHDHGTNT